MKCKNCNRLIWYWNKWREYPFYIYDKNKGFLFEERIYVCSDDCFKKLRNKLNKPIFNNNERLKSLSMKEIKLFLDRGL
jgi:hypothetical protein